MRPSHYLLVLLAVLLTSAAPARAADGDPADQLAQLPDWVYDGSSELIEVPEPSGLCYCPATDTLFIVDDGGIDRPPAVYELDLHARVLASREIGMDLEGLCYCSEDGLLYVADEADEIVYMLNPDGLETVGQFEFARGVGSEPLLEEGGHGIEGIEYIPGPDGGYFVLLNQDDPHALLKIEYGAVQQAVATGDKAPLAAHWLLPSINLGSLHFDQAANELWVVHSWMNVMEILDVPTMELKRWEVVPGAAQEAVAVDGNGRLWIGSDSGGIDRYARPGNESQPAE
jgi:uncharacterized protein YjiK